MSCPWASGVFLWELTPSTALAEYAYHSDNCPSCPHTDITLSLPPPGKLFLLLSMSHHTVRATTRSVATTCCLLVFKGRRNRRERERGSRSREWNKMKRPQTKGMALVFYFLLAWSCLWCVRQPFPCYSVSFPLLFIFYLFTCRLRSLFSALVLGPQGNPQSHCKMDLGKEPYEHSHGLYIGGI